MELLKVYGEKLDDGDVQIYRANGEKFARYTVDNSNKPDFRHKRVTLDCYQWALVWLKTKADKVEFFSRIKP